MAKTQVTANQIKDTDIGTADLVDGGVTLAKMANMSSSSLIYRKTSGDGPPEVNSLATLKTDLGLSGTNTGDNPGVTSVTGTAPITSSGGNTPAIGIDANTTVFTKYVPVTGGTIKPSSDSLTTLQVKNSTDTSIFDVDTTNKRVGINTSSPESALSLGSTAVDGTPASGITMSGDVNLYRSYPNVLKTDDTFNAVTDLQRNGASVVAYGDNIFYYDNFSTKYRVNIPENMNTFFLADKRFTVTQTGFATFSSVDLWNSNYESLSNSIAVNTSATITIDIIGKSEYNSNGIIYPGGFICVHTYNSGTSYMPATAVSGRMQVRSASGSGWTNLGTATIDSTTKMWTLPVPSTPNYIVTFEITIVATTTTGTTYVTSIEHNQYRHNGYPIIPLLYKYAGQKLFHNWTWNDSSNVAQVTISPTAASILLLGLTLGNDLKMDGTTPTIITGTNKNLTTTPNGTGYNLQNKMVYGSMYMDDQSVSVTITSTASYYAIASGFTSGSVYGFTFQNSSELKCLVAGKYMVHWSLTVGCATGNQHIEGGVMIGSTSQINTLNVTHNSNPNDEQGISGTGIITLAVNDLVKLCVANETATNNLIISHANLTILRLDA